MNTLKGLAALILLITLALPAVAQRNSSLTILKVLNTAEHSNPTLQAQELQLKNARVSFERSMASSDARIDRMDARLQWDRAHLTFNQGKANQLLSIAETYVELQQANENISNLKRRLRLAHDDLKKATERVAIGAASPVEEIQTKVSVLNAKLSLASARNARQFNILPTFSEDSGIDVNILSSAILASNPPEVPDIGTLDTYLSTTITREENDHAARQLEIADLNLQLLSSTSTSILDLQTAANTVTSSQAEVLNTTSTLQSSTASAYASAQQALGTAELRELQLELQSENTRRTKKQHSAGLLTDSQLASSELDRVEAIHSLQAANWTAYFSWVRLHRAAGTDLLGIWATR
jgi:outer membrane protein TolC